jgi:hypothetical protein
MGETPSQANEERVIAEHVVLHRLASDVVDIEVVRVDASVLGERVHPVVAENTAGPGKSGGVLKKLRDRTRDNGTYGELREIGEDGLDGGGAVRGSVVLEARLLVGDVLISHGVDLEQHSIGIALDLGAVDVRVQAVEVL